MVIDHLDSGGLIFNYQCTAACRHCLYASSPGRDGRYMDPELLKILAGKAASMGCGSFHIGGGEPFIRPNELLANIRLLSDLGTGIEYLETNGFWYTGKPEDLLLLNEIKEAGCPTLMISVCPYHIEHIPLARALGLAEACRGIGLDMFIWQEQFIEELGQLDPDETHSVEELTGLFGDYYLLDTARRYGLSMNGRALLTYKPFLSHRPAEEIVGKNGGPCGELTNTKHFHLDCDGNYIPPGCVGLSVHYSRLGAPLAFDEYPHFNMLYERGIKDLFGYALDAGYVPKSEGFCSKCDLCLDIRSFLIKSGRTGGCSDLRPDDFYPEVAGRELSPA